MSKFIIVIVSALLAILAINNSQIIKENWVGGPTLKSYVSQEVRDPSTGNSYSLSNNIRNVLGDNSYPTVSYPALQGALSPRFINNDLGSSIQYNLPDSKHMAANVQNALTYSNYVQSQCSPGMKAYSPFQEDFVPSCQKGGLSNNNTIEHLDDYMDNDTSSPTETPYPTETSSANGVQSQAQSSTKMSALAQQMSNVFGQNNIMSALPVSGMNHTLSQSGEDLVQPMIYDRYMFANQKSKLQTMGDPIRGDLAIIPNDKGWFQPSVNPSIDLHQGAMNILAGNSNENAKALSDLIYDTSGRTVTSIAGADMKRSLTQRATQKMMKQRSSRAAMMGVQADVDVGPIANGSPVYATTFP